MKDYFYEGNHFTRSLCCCAFYSGVKNQSVETSDLTRDYREALCEYIWNGFEAGATEVKISYSLNELEGVQDITIFDNGSGIN
jgi:hypothetical protein